MGGKDGQEWRASEGEDQRRNYAIAAVCIRHSHSIVHLTPNILKSQQNFTGTERHPDSDAVKKLRC
jgi:hypothetical protein